MYRYEREQIVANLQRQMAVFASCVIECGRCRDMAPMTALFFSARGLICKRCLESMPREEFRELYNATLTGEP